MPGFGKSCQMRSNPACHASCNIIPSSYIDIRWSQYSRKTKYTVWNEILGEASVREEIAKYDARGQEKWMALDRFGTFWGL